MKNMIALSDHSQWMSISAVTPYSILCLRKKVKELNLEWFDVLRAMNNKFLRRTILEIFTCDKCYQYFNSFMNYLFNYDKAKVKLDYSGNIEDVGIVLHNKILNYVGIMHEMKEVDHMKYI